MKTLQTMRGRLSLFALINILVFGAVSIENRISDSKPRRTSPALQISNYFTPETRTPPVSDWTLCACTQFGLLRA